MTMVKFASSKLTAKCVSLCFSFSLLLLAADCTSSPPTVAPTSNRDTEKVGSTFPTPPVTTSKPKPEPPNPDSFKATGQNETSINLQWSEVEGVSRYTLEFDGRFENVSPAGSGLVQYTISGLSSGTVYSISLFSVLDEVESSKININASTAPSNPKNFEAKRQNESSITLQWDKVNETLDYTIAYDQNVENLTSPSSEKIEYIISQLTAGTRYSFTLFTVFRGMLSTGVTLTAVTAPQNPDDFQHKGQNETSITLGWTAKNQLSYTLVFNGSEENFTSSSLSSRMGSIQHVVLNLLAGTNYSFELFSVFDYARSSGVAITAVTAPINPAKIEPDSQTETSITWSWTPVAGVDSYILLFNNDQNVTILPDTNNHTIQALESGTEYVLNLFTKFKYARSSGKTTTAATVPPSVGSVSVTERSVSTLAFRWESKKEAWGYKVQLNGTDVRVTPPVQSQMWSSTISNLESGTKYVFSVITQFSGLNSTAVVIYTVTTIDCTAVNWQVTNSSIKGTVEGLFTKATASGNNSIHDSPAVRDVSFTGLYPGATYEVQLDYELTSSQILSQCKHSLTLIPPTLLPLCKFQSGYSIRVLWENPGGIWTNLEINMTERTFSVNENQKELVIDGLQPAKTYQGSLASKSGDRRSATTAFSCSTDPTAVIAGSVVAVLLVCILVCLAVVILVKRPDIIKKKSFIGGSKQQSSKSKPIPAAYFVEHFQQLSRDDDRGFGQEYEDLAPVGTDQARRAALLPENKPKNRFTNVLPYDWCRVKLTTPNPSESTDYINANYMPGYNNNREFIATQGPLPGTTKDFWRMIWEQRVKHIAMVTNCVEGGRTKCERYWPDDGKPHPYGDLLVSVKSEQKEPNWTLREFTVKNTKTSEERIVKHFHFTAWPDHGVPEGTNVLMHFRGLLRQHMDREGTDAPTVVHCSAGVGRTGTLIALDVLLQQLEKERSVDINHFVKKMRLNRPYMVQTESQYIFLHQCIVDALKLNQGTEETFYENVGAVYMNATALRELR